MLLKRVQITPSFQVLPLAPYMERLLLAKKENTKSHFQRSRWAERLCSAFHPTEYHREGLEAQGVNSVNWLCAWLSWNCQADPLQLQKWLMKYQTHRSCAWWVHDIRSEFHLSNQPLGLGVHLTRNQLCSSPLPCPTELVSDQLCPTAGHLLALIPCYSDHFLNQKFSFTTKCWKN